MFENKEASRAAIREALPGIAFVVFILLASVVFLVALSGSGGWGK